MNDKLNRAALRGRIRPIESLGPAPDALPWVDWAVGDERLALRHGFYDTAVGRLLVADTPKGVCFIGFATAGDAEALADLRRRFAGQPTEARATELQKAAAAACEGNFEGVIPLHLKGTAFQREIWLLLLRIPVGALCSYGALSPRAGAARAVGSAVGANPVSVLVPCHRVVRADGGWRGYYWGTPVKERLLLREL